MEDLLISDSLSATVPPAQKETQKRKARQESSSRAPVIVSG
jgi:hypothetical protein